MFLAHAALINTMASTIFTLLPLTHQLRLGKRDNALGQENDWFYTLAGHDGSGLEPAFRNTLVSPLLL